MEWQIERHAWVDSTNTLAVRRAREGAPEGTVVVAEGQRAGRGRGGSVWESPYGKNIYASVILRPPLTPALSQGITLVVGEVLAEALAAYAGARITIKWPNDLLLDGKKLAGILTEASVCGGELEYVVVGFGINVNSRAEDFSPALRASVISLAMATRQLCDREAVLARCLAALAAHYATFVGLPNRTVSAITPTS